MVHNGFTSEFFAANRIRLRELFTGTAPIVLTGNGLVQCGADMSYPFCQDASFWYFTGCEEPDVIWVGDKDKDYLIVPTREGSRVAFDGLVDEVALRQISGIDTIFNEEEGWKRLGNRLTKVKHVATLAAAPTYIERLGMYANPARQQLVNRLQTYNEAIELLDISQHVARLRTIKQPVEIAALQRAIDITVTGLQQVLRPATLSKYGYEYEIEADLTRSFRRQGARGHAFTPIVAGGQRACTLHNIHNDSALSADELLLCDVGADYHHYAADITRTVSLRHPSRRQELVHEAVLETHQFAVSLLEPGRLLKQYEEQVEHFIGEKLRTLGLIKTIEHEAVRRYFPHATSHFLGLNPHDVGVYDQPLEAGMVLTVEPGIYITEEAIGVRIEDDVLITPDGNVILSKALPRTLAAE